MKDYTTLGKGNGKRWSHDGLESLPPIRRYVQVEYDYFYNLYSYIIMSEQLLGLLGGELRLGVHRSDWEVLRRTRYACPQGFLSEMIKMRPY